MRLLLDTHILIWLASQPEKPPAQARSLIEDPGNEVMFSVVSLWEIAIKNGLGRDDFRIDPAIFHRGLIENGYAELALTGSHAVAVGALPPLHKDPFDRMLVAQAMVEGITLVERRSSGGALRRPRSVRLKNLPHAAARGFETLSSDLPSAAVP